MVSQRPKIGLRLAGEQHVLQDRSWWAESSCLRPATGLSPHSNLQSCFIAPAAIRDSLPQQLLKRVFQIGAPSGLAWAELSVILHPHSLWKTPNLCFLGHLLYPHLSDRLQYLQFRKSGIFIVVFISQLWLSSPPGFFEGLFKKLIKSNKVFPIKWVEERTGCVINQKHFCHLRVVRIFTSLQTQNHIPFDKGERGGRLY